MALTEDSFQGKESGRQRNMIMHENIIKESHENTALRIHKSGGVLEL